MRQEHLKPRENYKDPVDKLFRNMCKKDGVLSVVAQLYYDALKKLGDPAIDPKNAKEVHKAP